MIKNLNYCFKLKLKMFVKIFKKAKESNYFDEANNLKNEICKVKDQICGVGYIIGYHTFRKLLFTNTKRK